ncbi:caveolae-associated protein 4a [Sardina pilchardus]|uniref:caveolae-associated protein 4a n=1 Tax=Sardina pilchardus TaxID=27697 RepID=UPI002E16010A
MATLGAEAEGVCVLSVLALLERVSGVLEGVQSSQARMADQQGELESQVATMRQQVSALGSEHAQTAAVVQKLLQKSRRVSAHVKEVKSRVDKQNARVRKVETSQDELLTRNRFRVVIYQGDTELPSVAVTKVPKGAGLSAVEVEPDEYEPPEDLSSDDDYVTAETVESTRASRLRAGLLATRQRTSDNLRKTGATLRQGGASLGGRVRGLGQRVVPTSEQRQRMRQSGQRLRQTIAEKAPNIRLRPPRSVAEGEEEGGAEVVAAATPPKSKRKQEATERERQGPLSEEGATSVPLDA